MIQSTVKKIDALESLLPGVCCLLDGDVIIDWADSRPQPTEAEITAKIAELEAAEPMRLLREERNRRIAATDWWASSDLTMTAAQTAYRQALRDITDTYTSLDDVVWPEVPA